MQTRKALEIDKNAGALINDIVKDSPAEKAGLERGDVILKVDDKEVKDVGHLQYLIASKDVGDKVALEILREGKTKTIKLTLEQMPDDADKMISGTAKEDNIEKYGINVSNITPELTEKFDLDKDDTGIVVTATEKESSFKVGDIIQRVDNKKVKDVDEFKKQLDKIDKEYFLVLIKRDGNTFFLTIETQK